MKPCASKTFGKNCPTLDSLLSYSRQCFGKKFSIGSMLRQTAAAFLAALCSSLTSCATLVTSIDHKKDDWENAYLWRREDDNPTKFYPKALSRAARVTPQTGDWIVDPQDKVAFYIPFEKCGDLTPSMWRIEAIKAINKYDVAKQNGRNTAMVLFGWPALTAGIVLSGLAH